MGWSNLRRITIGSFVVVVAGILVTAFGLFLLFLAAWLGIVHFYDR